MLLYNKQFWYCDESPLHVQCNIRVLIQNQMGATDQQLLNTEL